MPAAAAASSSSSFPGPGRNIHQLSIDVDKSVPPSRPFQGRPSPFAPYLGGGVLYRPPTPAALLLPDPTPTPAAAAAALPPTKTSSTDAPEKQLTLFAMRLAAMEKVASHVGTLAFVWATVVLLGGFAITLKEIDFWFVTVILVIEGARIFSRSHELEWQHQDGSNSSGSLFSWAYQKGSQVFSTMTSSGATPPENGAAAATLLAMHKPKRTWSTSSVPIFPWIHIRARHISRLFYWAQILAAVAATTMAVYRLITRKFTRSNEVEDGTYNNHSSALLIFYSLATFEAAVFLLERIYWEIQISYRKILIHVNKKSGLQDADLATTRRFFYDVYGKCLNDSIFAGLDMDLVDYALSAIQSDQSRQQLGGLRFLLAFCQRPGPGTGPDDETLRSIGVKQGAIERLLEMVTWKNPEAYDIRNSAANLLCELVKSNRYSVRVASVSGAIEGIFSLLVSNEDRDAMETGGMELCATPAASATFGGASVAAKVMEMRVVGLRILKNLAKDPVNSAKIGATRGLLTRLVTFIDTNKEMLRAGGHAPQIPQVKKALQLLNLLAAAPGSTGRILREDIAKIVFTVSNLQKIIEFGEAHISLQFYAMEILSSLAMADEGVKSRMGRAGGVIRGLLAVLLRRRRGDGADIQLAQKAGEALALLALKDKENCRRMMALRVGTGGEVLEEEDEEAEGKGMEAAEALVDLIDDYDVGDIAMDILRSFCAYSEVKPVWKWREACERKAAKVWKERAGKAQVAAMGLAAKLAPEVGEALEEEGMSAEEVAGRLGGTLERWGEAPPAQMPRGRRYAVEMVVGLARREGFREAFRRKEIRGKLRRVWRTVTDVEDYATFSGSAGVCPHGVAMAELLRRAMDALQEMAAE